MANRRTQFLKPTTAAKKLGIYLPAAPEEIRSRQISREELDEWQVNPPQWLVDLRRHGPHPRQVISARLRISNSGLARGGITEALTSEEINQIQQAKPDWLLAEQENYAKVKAEEDRLRSTKD